MPRLYVNAFANFAIADGMVGFTLQDRATRMRDSEPVAAPPEDVVDVIMREADFAEMIGRMQDHLARHLAHASAGAPPQGPRLGDPAPGGGRSAPMGGMTMGPKAR